MIKKIFNNLFKSELQSKIAKGVFWSFFGTFISRGFIFLAYILIANEVSLIEYGEIGILKSIIVTFSLFSLASFGITATRYISLYKEKDLQRVQKILSITYYLTIAISFIIFLAIIIFSRQFSVGIIGNEKFKNEAIIISFAIFFSALNGFQNGALAGFEKFKNIATVNILNGVLAIPILYILTQLYGVLGFCFGMAIQYFLLFLYSSYFLKKAMKENGITFVFQNLKSEIKVIKKFSIPSFLGGFIISPTILYCNNILVKSNSGFVSMGIYEAAFNFSIIAMTFNSMIGQVIYPYAIKMFHKKNEKFEFFNLNMPWLIGVFLGLFLIYIPDVFSLIFDKKYHNLDMYRTVSCIALFIIFISHRQGISRNLAAINKMWYGLVDNIIWAILAIIFTYIFLERGAPGRAFAFVVAYFVNSLFILPFYTKKKVFDKKFIYSTESLFIWLIVFGSFITVFFNFNLFIRLLLLITSLLFLFFVSYIWYLKYPKKNTFNINK